MLSTKNTLLLNIGSKNQQNLNDEENLDTPFQRERFNKEDKTVNWIYNFY